METHWAGDVLWDDKNGDNVINSYDRQVVGNIYPKWTGGFFYHAEL